MPDRLLRDQLQSTLGGAYTVERELGGGGMSRVFVAHEERLGRKVVLKVLTPELAADVSASRFEREIKLVAALQQANIVPLLSAGETNGLPFYTMPFVEGLSLRARLARDGALPIADVVSVVRDVARALAYAHEHGVVHRDIKPENILLSGDAAVVADFGIAKALAAAKRGERPEDASPKDPFTTGPTDALTEIGTSLGTPAYMSPEQASGDPSTDHRTDFYALGCVVYEMLTGAPPFAGRPLHQLFAAHMTEAPRYVAATRPDCPPPLAALVMRCLEKDPARRPQSAREILQALDSATTPVSTINASLSRRRWVVAAAVVVVAIVVAVAVRAVTSGSRRDIRSIAVLPFDNVGGDSTQEYFSDGIADEVSSALAQVAGIRVAARSSANMFKGKQPDPRDVGAKLHVGGVVEGSVRRLGDKLHVTAELVSAGDGLSLWSKTYERPEADAPALQREITDGVVGALRVHLAGASSAAVKPAHMPDPRAYDDYLKGRFHVSRGSRADLEKALEYFRDAHAIDPAYAAPYASEAFVYGQLADAYIAPNDAYPKMREGAQRAIALDSTLAEGHAMLAFVLLEYDWSWDAAKRELDRTLALNPSEPLAVQSAGVLDWIRGDTASALKRFKQWVALDPVSPFAHAFLSHAYFLLGSPDSSIAEFAQAQELEPGYEYGQPIVDEAYRAKGRLAEALRVDEDAVKRYGHPTVGLALTYVAMGRRADAVRTLERVEASVAAGAYQPPELIARCYAALGDTARVLEYLKKGVDAHSAFAPLAMWYPELRWLRNDPRYAPLKARMHL